MSDTAPVAHFVGGIPMEDAESVFRKLGTEMNGHVRRIPDGETGRRRMWISFVKDILLQHPNLEIDPNVPRFQFIQFDGKVVFEIDQLRFRSGVNPAEVMFQTGYADDAIRNFNTFDRLHSEGVIPAHVRYQICMATPFAITCMFVSPSARQAFGQVYGQHIADEVARIMAELPHERISYQWDVCQEVLMWEGYLDQSAHPAYRDEIPAQLSWLGSLVPNDVELGYHLCYGSPADEHLILPKDMGNLVEIANFICGGTTRKIEYVHMPVPDDRNDEAYFAPLGDLALSEDTDLYLGCVHHGDAEGNARKLAAAQKFTAVAGVGAECGLGRGKPERLDDVLEQHRKLT
ncbi:MAG: hypothetical protein VYA17_09725 [Pseudomonadota bacterium]|nr:hypothetical protein [Pseudomonadota bacterium]